MSLESALARIDKEFGKGSLIKMNEIPPIQDVMSTGIVGLDWALGIGGFPYGRIIEIYGQQAVGKTTIALTTIAEIQKKGDQCAYIDAEHAMNPEFAKMLGVNVNELLISQCDSGEAGLAIAEILVQSGDVKLIVVDSVAALVPKAELDGDIGDQHMALQARLMSQGLRKLTAVMSKSKCSIIFINQLRQTINSYGPSQITTGGVALPYYATIRLEAKKGETIKEGENIVGHEIRVKVVKNKVAPPYKNCTFELNYTKGISSDGMLLDIAIEKGLIKKSGSWYSYDDNRIGQGAESAKNWLSTNIELRNKIIAGLYAKEG